MPHSFPQMSMPLPNSSQHSYGSPPPGYGAPPLKKSSTAKIVFIVLACVFGSGIFIVGILAAILFPVFQKTCDNARLSVCMANVRQIELGMVVYAQDHSGNLPPSAARYKDALSKNALSAVGTSEQIFHCPADQNGEVDYALNINLQGKNLGKIPHPNKVVLIYEGKNQTLDFRDDGKAVVGFADGHDKALTKEQAQEWSRTQDLKWKP